jgi:hypothetical protein
MLRNVHGAQKWRWGGRKNPPGAGEGRVGRGEGWVRVHFIRTVGQVQAMSGGVRQWGQSHHLCTPKFFRFFLFFDDWFFGVVIFWWGGY